MASFRILSLIEFEMPIKVTTQSYLSRKFKTNYWLAGKDSPYRIESISSMNTNLKTLSGLQSVLMTLYTHHMLNTNFSSVFICWLKLMIFTILRIKIMNGFKMHSIKMKDSKVVTLQVCNKLISNCWFTCSWRPCDIKKAGSTIIVLNKLLNFSHLVISTFNSAFEHLFLIQILNYRFKNRFYIIWKIAFFFIFFSQLIMQIDRGLKLKFLLNRLPRSHLAWFGWVQNWSTLWSSLLSCLPRDSLFIINKWMIESSLKS